MERLVTVFWVSFEAVIIEKTLKEDWTNKNNFYDNYNYYSDTMIITTTFAHSVAFDLPWSVSPKSSPAVNNLFKPFLKLIFGQNIENTCLPVQYALYDPGLPLFGFITAGTGTLPFQSRNL